MKRTISTIKQWSAAVIISAGLLVTALPAFAQEEVPAVDTASAPKHLFLPLVVQAPGAESDLVAAQSVDVTAAEALQGPADDQAMAAASAELSQEVVEATTGDQVTSASATATCGSYAPSFAGWLPPSTIMQSTTLYYTSSRCAGIHAKRSSTSPVWMRVKWFDRGVARYTTWVSLNNTGVWYQLVNYLPDGIPFRLEFWNGYSNSRYVSGVTAY